MVEQARAAPEPRHREQRRRRGEREKKGKRRHRLEGLLRTLEEGNKNAHGGPAQWVRRVRVEGRVLASKGYGVRVSRVLKACPLVERVEVVGVDDLRAKHLVGTGTVTHLTLLSSSFRPNAHPSPPSLTPFLSSLTSLTLANLGLPAPATHLAALLEGCKTTLKHLAISSLRDVGRGEFRRAVAILARRDDGDGGRAPPLRSLMLGFLTDAQLDALTLPLLSSPSSPSTSRSSTPTPSPPSLAPALSHLPLTHLTLTLPLPTLPLLLALPRSLLVLAIRPPYARSSTVFGTDKASLLAAIARRPTLLRGSSARAGEEMATPLQSLAPTPAPGTPTRRRPSVTLEQLEEEECALLALEEALAVPPASLSPPPRRGVAGGADLGAVEGVVAPRLERVRWECRAMRCARERVGRVEEGRRRWRERVFGTEDGEGDR
ncbi:hypothetical protein JCM6882_008773 [Rhodosporidiobolus microsporus]